MNADSKPRTVAVLAFPDVQTLDVVGPLEVFSSTARLLLLESDLTHHVYAPVVLAAQAGPLRASSGIQMLAESIESLSSPPDTLLVAGGQGTPNACRDARLLDWLRDMAPKVRRLGSICTGSFVLAEAGLLDGVRCTTHWAWAESLQKKHPEIRVEPDAIFVRDGAMITSAGVTAGMDLALALVEEDWGRAVAMAVARQLVMFLKRPGGQSQFSQHLLAQNTERAPLRTLQSWVLAHLDADLSVPALARRAAMSPRHFARVFASEIGITPARFVQQARVDAARRLLEDTSMGVDAIADQCGFGSPERMRRAFARVLHTAPSAYRRRFSSP